MKTVNFIFGIHNHQPVGNFDFVIEDAFKKSYKPFIDVLEDFPGINVSFHFSGCLLEWLDENHPEYLDRIADLVKKGNIEIISGGFFEPVLAMIPDRDKIGQIKMMNDYISDRFGYEAKGLWLTERVWEPGLAKPIAEAGIEFITVDDYHFLGSGMHQNDLVGSFITEEQGYPLKIFPINQNLRYTIPFKDPNETIEYLRKFATEEGTNAIVMADDGEKFGVWPGTHEVVFKKNWLRYFFTKLQENSDWLKTTTFTKYNTKQAPIGRIYLPTASYFEMSEWSLPGDVGEEFINHVHDFEEKGNFEEIKPFFKGGMWRNFLSIYDESNWMQKKMQYLSNKIDALENKRLSAANKKQLEKAKYHMWKSSCNCTYWHGIFGGLYLPHLRHAVYQEMIISEKYLDQIQPPKALDFQVVDIDLDGHDEILIKNKEVQLAVSPAKGGIIEELSIRNKNYNVLNTLKRYKEAYHAKVHLAYEDNTNESGSIHDIVMAKEEGLDEYLNYDNHSRKMLVDHFIKKEVTIDQLQKVEYYEDSDFIDNEFNYQVDKRGKKVVMSRKGWVNWQELVLTKEIRIRKGYLEFYYKMKNLGKEENAFLFGPEFNFAMLGGEAPDRYYFSKDKEIDGTALISKGVEKGIKSFGIVNEYDGFKLEVKTTKKVDFWHFPVETVSLSEAGFERVYQSSVIIPFYEIKLAGGAEKEITLKLKISDI